MFLWLRYLFKIQKKKKKFLLTNLLQKGEKTYLSAVLRFDILSDLFLSI